ncbi:hypothetical protein LCGC14_0505570 [marine sediment metagenome]|uniref:HD domain-containing protein n=1 Tax=marine sediment metagenome TaxID=412755 RepID=A0A0F9SL71_9ZZZZ|nr:MAG: deoxyguanosinetriphosphate triphosphohydrolase-like protein [Candidatus Lokiarchaeum sp. GC14_75]
MPLIKNPLFSRLGRIRQLNNAWAIYPSGLNTRYIHSLGVMHLAGMFTGNILHRSLEELRGYMDLDSNKIEGIIRILRFWGLIHDIGHGPFSHAFEFYVLFNKGYNHETIVPEIYKHDKSFKDVIDDFANKMKTYYGGSLSAQLLLDIFRPIQLQKELKKHKLLKALSKLIMGPTYSIDEFDYLLRDSHFCGTKEYGTIDWQRIMDLTRVIISERTKKPMLILEEKALQALIDYYWAKFFMYNAVYYHNRCHAIEKYLRDIFIFLDEQKTFDPYLDKPNFKNYHLLDDSFILNTLYDNKVKLKSSPLKKIYSDYYQKLIDLYNFEIPYTFIGKKNNPDITLKISLQKPMERINISMECQKEFINVVREMFLEKIKELRKGDNNQVLVEKLEGVCEKYVDEVFFHHVLISANDKDFFKIKSPRDLIITPHVQPTTKNFYMLNEQMKEENIVDKYKDLLKRIPIYAYESKILIPNALHKALTEDFPDMIEDIKACYEKVKV